MVDRSSVTSVNDSTTNDLSERIIDHDNENDFDSVRQATNKIRRKKSSSRSRSRSRKGLRKAKRNAGGGGGGGGGTGGTMTPKSTLKSTIMALERHYDLATLQLIDRLAWPIVIGMLVVLLASLFSPVFLRNFALSSSVILMGMWIIWFVAAAAATIEPTAIRSAALTKWKLFFIFLLISIFAGVSCIPWKSVWYVFAAWAVLFGVVQVMLLLWALCCSSPSSRNGLQRTFYGTLHVVCILATATSLVFVYKSFQAWPSTSTFYSACAACFCFAYATFVAALVTGPRASIEDHTMTTTTTTLDETTTNHEYDDEQATYTTTTTMSPPTTIIFTCNAKTSFSDSLCCMILLTFLTNVAVAAAFLLLWPPPKSMDRHEWIVGAVYPSAFGCQALVYHTQQLYTARRFHVRSDGTILVETMCKTYVYDKAIHAYVEPIGSGSALPKQTETCHVYCAAKPTMLALLSSSVPIVVVELTRGRLLCLTPEQSTEFTEAVAHAIQRSSRA